jgi:CRISP-associated protein Cas1
LIYSAGKRINNIPIEQIERLIVAPHVVMNAGVLGVIAEQGLSLLVVNSRLPQRTAMLSGNNHGDICRRLKQYRLSLDQSFCLRYAIVLWQLKSRINSSCRKRLCTTALS